MHRTILLRGLVCLVMAVLGLLLVSTTVPALVISAQGVDRTTLVEQWIEARNQGDVDGVMALQTETASWIAGPCLAQSPCMGDRIRALAAANAAAQAEFTINNVQAAGSNVAGQYELRSDAICAAGVERIRGTFLISAPQDKITLYIAVVDVTDTQTATWVAVNAGGQAAGARPAACG